MIFGGFGHENLTPVHPRGVERVFPAQPGSSSPFQLPPDQVRAAAPRARVENTPLSEVPGIKILHPDTGTPLADSSLKSHSQSTAAQNAVMFLKLGVSARDGACCWDLLA